MYSTKDKLSDGELLLVTTESEREDFLEALSRLEEEMETEEFLSQGS